MMKLYRSIEFSRLTFLIDENHKIKWQELEKESRSKTNFSNWWLEEKNSNNRYQMIENIISDNDQFFTKSADFNSKVGGRFNPSRSFGAIYTSACPTLSMLEVLYHVFDSSLGLYKNLKRSSDRLTSSFNVPVPEKIEVLITALEIEVDKSIKLSKLCEDRKSFKKLCEELGFYRYIDNEFNEDFIFGNNYEITNIIGCHFHEKKGISLQAPSARVNINHQESGQYNVIIPEGLIEDLKPRLTGRFREYFCIMDMNEIKERHEITIKAFGNSDASETIYLQNKPTKRNKRIIEFSQVDDTGENKKRYSREVHLQRFIQ